MNKYACNYVYNFTLHVSMCNKNILIIARKKTETSSVYDCTVEDVELRYSHILFFCEEH